MKNDAAASTRNELLRATVRVVARSGAPALTLEAVAREAGVSKGGLLYHFPSKESLIRALMESFIHEWDLALEREYARDPFPELAGRWLRAFVRAAFADFAETEFVTLGLSHGDIVGTLAALATNPELVTILRRAYDRWHALMISDGFDEAAATAIRFAADGIYFAEAFGFAAPTGATRQETMKVILAWATPLPQTTSAKRSGGEKRVRRK
jgi:AcrR family transcriptional regulator